MVGKNSAQYSTCSNMFENGMENKMLKRIKMFAQLFFWNKNDLLVFRGYEVEDWKMSIFVK